MLRKTDADLFILELTMGTIMTRSGAECWWGEPLPDGVAYLVSDGAFGWGVGPKWTEVTYKELLDKKISQQRSELYRKLHTSITKPCFVWVFHNDTWLMGGWYLYIKTLKEDYALNFRRPRPDLVLQVMNLFPCGIVPVSENFNAWAQAFSKQFHHTGFKRKKNQGLVPCYCEIDGNHITNIKPK